MKKTLMTYPWLAVIVLALAACAGGPRVTSLLDEARMDYRLAQNNPYVATYAPLEMKLAGDAMDQANAAANKNESAETVDRLAYVARQKVNLAQEVAKKKLAQADAEQAARERDQIRLAQRTVEADQAKASADQAKANAQAAQAQAAVAQAQAANAQAQAADAQRSEQLAKDKAAQLEAQLAELSAVRTPRGIVITLSDVLFDLDRAELTPAGIGTVQKLALVLTQNPQRTVLIEGFTDSTGSHMHNQDLSERRAASVRLALQQMGVAGERVITRGYAEAYPVASNDTAVNRQLNRRVEILLSDASGRLISAR
jgi:outer membrane protein OmpA-like peptidoglycan-associated protein